MRLRTTLFGIVLLAVATVLPIEAHTQAGTQAGTFDLVVQGKVIGKDSYTLTKAKGDYKLMSRYGYRVGPADVHLLTEFKFSDAYGYVEGTSTNGDNQLVTSYVPSKTRTELTVAQFQAGNSNSGSVDIKPDLVILPSFDAGAVQALLLLAVTHPTANNMYDVLIPASGGGGGGGGRGGRGVPPPVAADATADAALPPGNNAYDALWGQGKDLTGTLDEKPITVHTYLFAFGKFRWIIFADTDNNLMQVNVSVLHASYIRQKFKLDPAK